MSYISNKAGTGGGGGGGITTINGDVGSATGATINLHGLPQAGSTMFFSAAGDTVLLNTTDAAGNVIIGLGSGNPAITGTANAGLGNNVLSSLSSGNGNYAGAQGALQNLTTGSFNSAFSNLALNRLVSGNYNQAIGFATGFNLTGAESSNIFIGHDVEGVTGDNNTLRIGAGNGTAPGLLNRAFIAGINGFTGSLGTQMVTIDSTNQLGVAPLPSGGGGITTINGNTGSATGPIVTINTANSTAQFAASGSANTLDFGVNNLIIGGGTLPSLAGGGANVGLGAGATLNAITSGQVNTAVGFGSMTALSSGSFNSSYGYNTGQLTSGSFNTILGASAGSLYGAGESSNILLGYNIVGTPGESNKLRIGAATGTGNGELNQAFIAGINGIAVSGSPVLVNSSNQLGNGIMTNAAQPAFFATSAIDQSNVTGDGTSYTVTFTNTILNQSSSFDGTSTFIAPVTGLYSFNVSLELIGLSAVNTEMALILVTTASQYRSVEQNPANIFFTGSGFLIAAGSFIVPMASGDSASITLFVNGGGATIGISGTTSRGYRNTYFSGYLVA